MSKIELVNGDLTERIVGVFYQVYRELGSGFLEAAYQRAMQIGLSDAGITVEREMPVTVFFRGQAIGEYRIDLLVDRCVIVECKTADRIVNAHRAQVINYLRATNHKVGLVLNFGASPTFVRLVYDTLRKH